MPRRQITPPVRGAANSTGFTGTPEGFAPADRLLNVRPFNVDTDRPTVGQRPGIRRMFGALGPEAIPVQALGVVSRASSVVGSVVGECEDLSGGESRGGGILTGQVWGLDQTPQMDRHTDVDAVAVAGAASDHGATAVALSPDGTRAVVALNMTSFAPTRVLLALIDTSDGTVLDTQVLTTSGIERSINTVHLFEDSGGRLFLLTAEYADPPPARMGLWGLAGDVFTSCDASTGNGWFREVVEVRTYTDSAGATFAYAAFMGNRSSGFFGPAGAGVIDAGFRASHFRAGIMKFAVSTGAGPIGFLTQINPYGAQLDPGDTFVEHEGPGGDPIEHGYFRISEQTKIGRPHGCRITCMDVASDGSVVIGRTNQGWGPNASYPPDGLTAQYATIMLIDPVGVVTWEVDTYSLLRVGTGGEHGTGYNDIPGGGSGLTESSISAVRFDDAGDIYCGGLRNDGGVSCFKLRAADGAEIWRANVMDASRSISQAGIWIDPTDQSPVIAGGRNSSWTGASGTSAHLWKLNPVSGAIIWHYDILENVTATGVAVDDDGKIWYVTDFVT